MGWSTGDEVDRTFETQGSAKQANGSGCQNCSTVGLLDSIRTVMNIVRFNLLHEQSTERFRWSYHRLNANGC